MFNALIMDKNLIKSHDVLSCVFEHTEIPPIRKQALFLLLRNKPFVSKQFGTFLDYPSDYQLHKK